MPVGVKRLSIVLYTYEFFYAFDVMVIAFTLLKIRFFTGYCCYLTERFKFVPFQN